MIAYVKGKLADLETDSVVLEAGGIGYQIFTPVNEDLMRLGIGSEVTLYTYFHVTQDAQSLYGFLRKESLNFFQLLLKVSGIGPKLALSVLTQMSEDDLILAISRGDHKSLNKLSGIGPKTAQRIVLELKDKVAPPVRAEKNADTAGDLSFLEQNQNKAGSVVEDAISVFQVLGYTRAEAEKAIGRVYAPGKDANTLVNEALEQM